ncbi:MAG TPA: acyl-CoA dehydrogenase family protein [Spirochaetota bacterium]|nr:acyl-CoA dehydrogenase family protein [Spirochaetota bacterium]
MSLPDRNNPYSFNDYLEWRKDINYYDDDPFIRKVVKHYTGTAAKEVEKEASEVSLKASYRWRDMAEAASWPEKRPYMMHYDGHHNRIDRIVRPRETEIMEKEIFGELLFTVKKSPWVKLIKMFLIYQNGEACIACPVTCTEGLVKLLERYADTPETLSILKHCREGINGDVAIGAQYLSEIQGGSDVPANLLEAVNEGGTWRLYGSKFFCSATHADYVVVTAKPRGAEDVALFVMPSWLPGDKEREMRNGYTIDRIKWKMGTSELTTGELTFNGAVAYPVGPLNRGVANVVGIVLTYSRLTVGLSAAAFMTRAVREAKQYTTMRQAFGITIGDFPMVMGQINEIEKFAQRTTAGAFRLYRDFLTLEDTGQSEDTPETKRKRFAVRELIMLQKITASMDSTDVIRKAMSIFGGHGIMEDFSSLPRLYRDSAINELWEGPRNVLLTQMHRDLQKASSWYPLTEFISDILKGADAEKIKKFSAELESILSHKNLFTPDEETVKICAQWDEFTARLFHLYQDLSLAEIG